MLRYYLRTLRYGIDYNFIAAGDDVCVFPRNAAVAERIVSLIRDQTSRDLTAPSSLGQVVKEVLLTDINSMEFCSKWFFTANGRLQATRDMVKLVATK